MNSLLPAATTQRLIYSAQVMSSLTSPTYPRLNLQMDSTVRLLLVEAQVTCTRIYLAAKCMLPVRVYFVSTCSFHVHSMHSLTDLSTVKIQTYCRDPTTTNSLARNNMKAKKSYYHVFTM